MVEYKTEEMMETTIEQKREAVIAECTLLFKDTVPGQVVVVSPGVSLQTGYIRDMFGPMHDHYACIDLRIAGNPCASLWEKSKDWEIDLFWCLLGLETRTAVAEKENMMGVMNDSIEVLREQLKEENRWISVMDQRKPTIGQKVLVVQNPNTTATREALFAFYDGKDFIPPTPTYFADMEIGKSTWSDIIFWMPLPPIKALAAHGKGDSNG